MHRRPAPLPHRGRPWWLALLGLAAIAPGLARATPAPEYGPEAEALFRTACEATGAAPHDCQAAMEGLQLRLGYAAFLETASLPPAAIEQLAVDPPRPAPLRLARQP